MTRVAREQRRAIGELNARAASWLAWSLCVVCVALAAASLILALLNGRSPGEIFLAWDAPTIVTIATLTVSFSVVGALIASHRPENPVGWIFLAVGFLQGLLYAGDEYAIYALLTNPASLPLGAEASWLGQWIWAPGLGLILVFLPLLFPDGHPPSNRWRWVAWLGGLSIGLTVVSSMILLWPERGPALLTGDENPSHVVNVLVGFIAVPMLFVAGLGAMISLFVRFRQARGDERQQIKWFASAAALTLVWIIVFGQSALSGLPGVIVALASLLVIPSIPIATGIAILRYRLYDIDRIINRTLVYGALSVIVIGLYVLVVGALGTLLQVQGSLFASLLATGLVAVLFAPLRDRLQHGVNRIMYGERDDPYAVLSRLGRRLEATVDPRAALTTIVETIAQALKVPHVAIALRREGDEFATAAEHGPPNPKGEVVVVPLVYQSETFGRLILASRAPDEPFSPADERLIEDLGRQAEVAVHAVRLTDELQRSRERLVTTREEERRRLRRDLHDGVGPQLAALTLELETATELVSDNAEASALMAKLSRRTRETIADVRRSVHALRPPTLDELGLVGALREAAGQYGRGDLRVSVESPEELSPLPAAAEVACYLIAREAMTNVVRHSGASNCWVRIALDEDASVVRLEVEDDGRGIGKNDRAGVGMHSMRERAEELGGSCTVGRSMKGGTLVSAHLPCRFAEVTDRVEE